jgi:hypothetical protein
MFGAEIALCDINEHDLQLIRDFSKQNIFFNRMEWM